MRTRAIGWAGVLFLLMAWSAYAQGRWYPPYERGLSAFRAGRWEEAVKYLEQAVAADARPGANKYVEGVFRADYFPYHYLAIAYLRLGQLDRAQQNVDRALRGPVSRDLAARLQDAQQELDKLRKPAAVAEKAPGAPAPPAVDPSFEPAVKAAETALAARRYGEALERLDRARDAAPEEFTRRNLQARRDEASRGLATEVATEGQQLLQKLRLNDAREKFEEADRIAGGQPGVAQGLAEIRRREQEYGQLKSGADQDFASGNLPAARTQYTQARETHPDRFASDNLAVRLRTIEDNLARGGPLAEARTAYDQRRYRDVVSLLRPLVEREPANREALALRGQAESQLLLEEGRTLAGRGAFSEAEAKYQAALAQDPSNKDAIAALDRSRAYADRVKQGRALYSEGKLPAAKTALEEAGRLDPQRFERDALARLLQTIAAAMGGAPTGLPAARVDDGALRNGLLALLRGDLTASISVLESALNQPRPAGTPPSADVHAYLGVAYATAAFSAPKEQEAQQLHEKALEEFRRALALRRDYALPARLVSPKILGLLDRARGN